MKTRTLAPDQLSVGQIYLADNPLLKRPLALADVKHMLLGCRGTTPGKHFIHVDLNRIIKNYDLDLHEAMARALDRAVEEIEKLQEDARGRGIFIKSGDLGTRMATHGHMREIRAH